MITITKKKNVNGSLVGAGLLIGLGIGLAVGQVAAGVIIGLGVGLVAMFIATKMDKK